MSRRNYELGLFGYPFFDDFYDGAHNRSLESVMKTDIQESENNYVLSMEMPGAKKEDIELNLHEGNLVIGYSVNEDKPEDNAKYIKKERFYGKITRSFYVGEDVKEEDIDATYENGVLKIIVPKFKPEEKVVEPKKINIK